MICASLTHHALRITYRFLTPHLMLYGGIEAGGTKFVCAVGSGPDDLRTTTFPTTAPDETLGRAIAFFAGQPEPVAAIGIGSFGPVDPDPASPQYGFITSTPKQGWANTDFAGTIRRALDVPVAFDTDVNAAALGEHRWGAAQGLGTVLYLTVGTGIGGGGLVAGRRMHGLLHPEMGHLMLPRHPEDDFAGHCPFHDDCLEGMAAGPAIEARWGQPGAALPPDHPAWAIEAHYLAHGITSFILTLSPQRVIVGGGVMHQPQLFPLVRNKVQAILNGYLQTSALLDAIDTYIVPPALGGQAGVLGALALAREIESSGD